MLQNQLKHVRKTSCMTAICLLMGIPVTFAAQQPDAGSILKNTEKNELTVPSTKLPIIVKEGSQQSPVVGGETLTVSQFHITGQDLFPETELTALLADRLGKEMTLGELTQCAGHISKYFRDRGYLVAYAFIPAQESKNNEITIEVVVGQYGQIDIRNHSRLSTSYINSIISPLKSKGYIRREQMERVLLLLTDTSGVILKNTLAPGKESGTSDLIIEVTDGPSVTGQVYSDNWGNRFTGTIREGINATFYNPGKIGDSLALGGLYTGSGLHNWSAAYSLPTSPDGGKLGISYSRVSYLLGENYASLDARGVAKTTSLYETYPLLRSRAANVNVRFGYDHKELRDQTGSNRDSQKQVNAFSLGLSGDRRDQAGDGITGFDVTVTSGHLTLNSVDARTDDIDGQTAGNYIKANLSLFRQKYLNSRLNYSLSLTSQWANKNLESSEKLSLGGASGVRAYPQGEASGDVGYLFTGELRWNLPTPQFQLVAFLDNGHVMLNKNDWDQKTSNNRSLTGAGLGVIFSRPNDYTIRMDYAWKMGSESAQSDTDKKGRLWIRGSKYF